MKTNETQQEILWIDGQPIPKSEPSDSALIGWMIFGFVVSHIIFAMFGGKNSD